MTALLIAGAIALSFALPKPERAPTAAPVPA